MKVRTEFSETKEKNNKENQQQKKLVLQKR